MDRWTELLPPAARFQSRLEACGPGTGGSWREAGRQIRHCEEIDELASIGDGCDCRQSTCISGQPPPDDERIARTDTVLIENAAALEHFEAAIATGTYQPNIDLVDGARDTSELEAIRPLVRLKRLQARRQIERNETDAAARSLAQILKAGRMLLACERTLTDYLVGLAVVGIAIDELDDSLDRARFSKSSLEMLQQATSGFELDDLLSHTLRAELARWTLPILEQFDRKASQADWAEYYVETFLGRGALSGEDEFAWRVPQLRSILDGHPAPWNVDEVARWLGLNTARLAAECESPENAAQAQSELDATAPRRDAFHAAWPQQFSTFVYNLDEPVEPDDEIGQSVHETMLEHNRSVVPLADEELRTVREAIRDIQNPLGIAVFDQLAGGIGRSVVLSRASSKMYALQLRIYDALYPSFRGRWRGLARRWRRKKN